jgi:hypothetical protein
VLHAAAFVETPKAQKAWPQVTFGPGKAHVFPFVPSQKPPQALEPRHPGRPARGAPTTLVHSPMWPTWSHAWHWPSQAVSQQTPSTQLPSAQ